MKKYLGIIAGAIVMFSACKPSDFGDTNTDPYSLRQATTRGLLTNSLQSVAGTVAGFNSATFYVQHISEGPYPGASLYNTRNFAFDATYAGPLYNLQAIIDVNSGKPSPDFTVTSSPLLDGPAQNQIAVARILKAYFFWWMTDRWGDIPYTEALKGVANVTPKYDTQESIYTDLFKELKEAEAQFVAGNIAGDIIMDGSPAAWKRFSATMRMMMALRYKKIKPAQGATEFNSAINAGVIDNVSQDVYYKYVGTDPNNWNPYYANYSISNRNDYAISNIVVNYMNPKQDPRLPIYGEVLASGNVVGLQYGSGTARNIPGVYSRLGDKLREAGSPALIFSYAQVLFAKAEMALPGTAWLPGGDAAAAGYYSDAIKASFRTWGVDDVDAKHAAYMTKAGVAYNPATALEQIMSQKWVHLYTNGFESWTDWRRTGFPTLAAAGSAAQAGGIPRRHAYGQNEATVNADNYKAVIARQGADTNFIRIWWDVQ